MKNTNKLVMMATITVLLIMGTSIIPMQSYAESGSNDEHKKNDDNKSKTSASSQTDKKRVSQHLDQDNVCYRGNESCTQANGGQQIIGKDNDAVGFNDQSNNAPQSTPSTATPTPSTATPTTCIECFRTIFTPTQIGDIETSQEDIIVTIREICEAIGYRRSIPGQSCIALSKTLQGWKMHKLMN